MPGEAAAAGARRQAGQHRLRPAARRPHARPTSSTSRRSSTASPGSPRCSRAACPARIGPVRSARITDVDLLAQYDRPAFAYSGAQRKMFPALDGADFFDVSPRTGGAGYSRDAQPASALQLLLRRPRRPRPGAEGVTGEGPGLRLRRGGARGWPGGDVRGHEVGLLLCRLRLPQADRPLRRLPQRPQGRRRGERQGPERLDGRHPVREAATVGVLRQGWRQHPARRHHRQRHGRWSCATGWRGTPPGAGPRPRTARRSPSTTARLCRSSPARSGSCCWTGSARRTSSRSPCPSPSHRPCRRRRRRPASSPSA